MTFYVANGLLHNYGAAQGRALRPQEIKSISPSAASKRMTADAEVCSLSLVGQALICAVFILLDVLLETCGSSCWFEPLVKVLASVNLLNSDGIMTVYLRRAGAICVTSC